MRVVHVSRVSLVLVGCVVLVLFSIRFGSHSREGREHVCAESPDGSSGCYVPNLGQWEHPARFVHRSGRMTVFVGERDLVLDLDCRAALRMTFVGDARAPKLIGEDPLPGHHNFFLGSDPSRWRTGVPLFRSVLVEGMYPGIDLRLREAGGAPVYDLLLEPGADLGVVSVHVEGATRLSLQSDGALWIHSPVGPMIQPVPKTWEIDSSGARHAVRCDFVLLGKDRFGFAAPDWRGDTSLTIDPGLLWSTYVGHALGDAATAVAVDADGLVTVAGQTSGAGFPTTVGAYDTTFNKNALNSPDACISRFDPRKSGRAQLLYSTFFGGKDGDTVAALSVDPRGAVTVTGTTGSRDLPTTNGAFDRKGLSIYGKAFVATLDPSKTGAAQLVYSTYLAGGNYESADALSVAADGVVTVAGTTGSPNFPTTRGAYKSNKGAGAEAFVSRLDPRKSGAAQLVYSTLVSGGGATAVAVDANGVITVGGSTWSNLFPTTKGAYDTTYNGQSDAFVSRIDPRKSGNAQLVYSTLLGGKQSEWVEDLTVDSHGVITMALNCSSADYPTTKGAFDTTYAGPTRSEDAVISRLDPRRSGTAQLVYSTFLGAPDTDRAEAIAVDDDGVVTVVGWTRASKFPVTPGAFDTTFNREDGFVSRLDPRASGSDQLVYSTFLGGNLVVLSAVALDASGTAIVAGATHWDFPTTPDAFDRTFYVTSPVSWSDQCVSRLDMGVPLRADVHRLSLKRAGTQVLHVNAGRSHARRSYWILGSFTGTRPGVRLPGFLVPLNPDRYTDFTISHANTATHQRTRGTLDHEGRATASIHVPSGLPPHTDFTLHHACIVFDSSGRIHLVSNPVPVALVN